MITEAYIAGVVMAVLRKQLWDYDRRGKNWVMKKLALRPFSRRRL